MYPGNIVMDRTAIQSDKVTDKTTKLRYAVRRPFQFFRITGRGSYVVRKLNKPDNSEFKFMSGYFYIFCHPL